MRREFLFLEKVENLFWCSKDIFKIGKNLNLNSLCLSFNVKLICFFFSFELLIFIDSNSS